ncbi:hypothetical protein RIF25_02770 [Thermosynechococcaceae cyanobacterium BACA0444]|uniref:P-type ATPase A domain-containing protein n=1 Tax=Pseudocalidococcus azoricus BACA0444 TaxID=2918990 RepID=A0AAE4JXD1_9CYAN|nr:hypothetical protein [Pseudocalidococcus azoricus]MDS3859724.1 hypothetical protein [Pseudocalidococcus azoricus BACA0444]
MDYQVLHHSPGRLRLHIHRLRHDRAYGQTVENLVLALPIVLGARLNRLAASLVVHYYTPGLAPGHAETLVAKCLDQADITHPLVPTEPFPTPSATAIRDWEAEVEAERPPESDWERLGFPLMSLTLALLAAPGEIPPLVVGIAVLAGAWPWFQRTQTRWATEQSVSVDLLDTLWLGLHTLNGEFIAPALKTSLTSARADLRDHGQEFSPYPSFLLNPEQLLTIERNQEHIELTTVELQLGDRLWIEAGQIIPVDGPIVAGAGMLGLVHQGQTLTTISVAPGQFVYAGSQLLSGQIQVTTTRIGWQTRIGLVTELRQAEPVYDSQLAQAQAQFAHQAVLPTLVLSGCVLAATGNLAPALAPLQLDFGSGIQLSLRTVFLSALIAAAQAGVYIPSAASLECLAHLEVLVVDQRGLALTPLEMRELEHLAAHNGLQLFTITGLADLDSLMALDQTRGIGVITGPGQAFDYSPDWLRIFWGSHTIHPQEPEIVILEPTVRKLHWAITIAHQALARAYQNTTLISLPNLIIVAAGVMTGLSPVVNVLTNNATAFLVEFLPQPPFLPPPARTSLLPLPGPGTVAQNLPEHKKKVKLS